MKNSLIDVISYEARESLKLCGRQLLAEGKTLAARADGAVLCAVTYWARSREHCGGHARHPTFEDYVRMIDAVDHGAAADVVTELRVRYGAPIDGVIPKGTTNWSPPSASPPSSAPWPQSHLYNNVM